MKEMLKAVARAAATIVMIPALCSYFVRSRLMGSDRALLASSQAIGLIPGLTGQYLRRAFLARVLAHCAPSAAIEWGTLFSSTQAHIDDYVYIGPNCHIGHVHLEHDVLLAPAVQIPSGAQTHGTDDPDAPIRDQEGMRHRIRIGANSWIGGGAIVMADVGPSTIVGAGSVVTKPLPGRVVAAGVPAKVVRERASADARDAVGS